MDLNLVYWYEPVNIAHSDLQLQIKNILPTWLVDENGLGQQTSCKELYIVANCFTSLGFSRRCFPEVGRTAVWPAISCVYSVTRNKLGKNGSFRTFCPCTRSCHSAESYLCLCLWVLWGVHCFWRSHSLCGVILQPKGPVRNQQVS